MTAFVEVEGRTRLGFRGLGHSTRGTHDSRVADVQSERSDDAW